MPKFAVGSLVTITHPDYDRNNPQEGHHPPVTGVVQSVDENRVYTITYSRHGEPHRHLAHERLLTQA